MPPGDVKQKSTHVWVRGEASSKSIVWKTEGKEAGKAGKARKTYYADCIDFLLFCRVSQSFLAEIYGAPLPQAGALNVWVYERIVDVVAASCRAPTRPIGLYRLPPSQITGYL